MLQAVITGDLINSTSLAAPTRSGVIASWLRQALPTHTIELSRGDSFQLAVPTADALRLGLSVRAFLRAQPNRQKYRPDARISIGFGTIEFTGSTLATSAGSAFEYSGRGLEKLKGEINQIQISSDYTAINLALNTSLTLLEWLITRWTAPQAQAVYHTLSHQSQQRIATLEQVSQPAIQQRLQTAGWPAIDTLLSYYDTLTHELVAP